MKRRGQGRATLLDELAREAELALAQSKPPSAFDALAIKGPLDPWDKLDASRPDPIAEAEYRAIREMWKPSWRTRFGSSALKGAGDSVGLMVKGADTALSKALSLIPGRPQTAKERERRGLTTLSQQWERHVQPAMEAGIEFLAGSARPWEYEGAAGKVGQVVGSSVGFMAAGGLSGASLLGVAGAGALANAQSAYEEALEATGNEETAWNAWLANAPMGATEAIPVAKWAGRLAGPLAKANTASGGRLGRLLLKTGVEAGEEFVQEAAQTGWESVWAEEVLKYREDTPFLEQIKASVEAGLWGAAGAGILSPVTQVLGGEAFQRAEPAAAKGAAEVAEGPPEAAPPAAPLEHAEPGVIPADQLEARGRTKLLEAEADQASQADFEAAVAKDFGREAAAEPVRAIEARNDREAALEQEGKAAGVQVHLFDGEGRKAPAAWHDPDRSTVWINSTASAGEQASAVLKHELFHELFAREPEQAKALIAGLALSYREGLAQGAETFLERRGTEAKKPSKALVAEEGAAYLIQDLSDWIDAAATSPEVVERAYRYNPGLFQRLLDALKRLMGRKTQWQGIAKELGDVLGQDLTGTSPQAVKARARAAVLAHEALGALVAQGGGVVAATSKEMAQARQARSQAAEKAKAEAAGLTPEERQAREEWELFGPPLEFEQAAQRMAQVERTRGEVAGKARGMRRQRAQGREAKATWKARRSAEHKAAWEAKEAKRAAAREGYEARQEKRRQRSLEAKEASRAARSQERLQARKRAPLPFEQAYVGDVVVTPKGPGEVIRATSGGTRQRVEVRLATGHRIRLDMADVGVQRRAAPAKLKRMSAAQRAERELAKQERRGGERAEPRFALDPDAQRRQTETPEFKRWFGDSKVVDGNGKPLAVYHGAPDTRELNVFLSPRERLLGVKDDPERGFWFTSDRRTAKTYADDRRAYDYQNADPGVLAVFLSMQNPLEIDASGASWKGTRHAIARARAEGHDGVIVHNVVDDYITTKRSKPTTTYMVLNPHQIKSATGNTGAFDPSEPDIRFSLSPAANLEDFNAPFVEAAADVAEQSAEPTTKGYEPVAKVTRTKRGRIAEAAGRMVMPPEAHTNADVLAKVDADIKRSRAAVQRTVSDAARDGLTSDYLRAASQRLLQIAELDLAADPALADENLNAFQLANYHKLKIGTVAGQALQMSIAASPRQHVFNLITVPTPMQRRARLALEKAERGREPAKVGVAQRMLDRIQQRENKRIRKTLNKLARYALHPNQLSAAELRDPRIAGMIATIASTSRTAGVWDWYAEMHVAGLLTIESIGVNIIGNSFLWIYRGPVRRVVERMYEIAFPGSGGPVAGENFVYFGSLIKAATVGFRAAAESWSTEHPAIERMMAERGVKVLGLTEFGEFTTPGKFHDDPRAKIPGPQGRIVRHTFRALLAGDQFFKGLVSTMEADALAYRRAVREGFIGEAAELEGQRQLSQHGGVDLWQEAYDEALRGTFQSRAHKWQRALISLRNELNLQNRWKVAPPLGTMAVPFLTTPLKIFEESARIGGAPLVPLHHLIMRRKLMAPEAAEALMALGLLTWIFSLMEPDEDGLPRITGPSAGPGARQIENVTLPPNSIRFGKDTWIDFDRMEPLSTVAEGFQTLIGAAKLMLNEDNPERFRSAFKYAWERALGIIEDKTFLRSVGDISTAMRDPEGGRFKRLVRSVATTWTFPNTIQKGLRSEDDQARIDRGDWSELLPSSRAPSWDYQGRPVLTDGATWATRFMWPFKRKRNVDQGNEIDWMLMRWADRVRNGEVGPNPRTNADPVPYWPQRERWSYRGREWSTQEKAQIDKRAGDYTRELLQQNLDSLNTNEPGWLDIDLVKKIRSKALQVARYEVLEGLGLEGMAEVWPEPEKEDEE